MKEHLLSASYLRARPSFLEGMARVLDIGGKLQLTQPLTYTEQDDWLAIAGDWQAVGDDLWQACVQFDAENGLDIAEEQRA